jgi:hypothetical protein
VLHCSADFNNNSPESRVKPGREKILWTEPHHVATVIFEPIPEREFATRGQTPTDLKSGAPRQNAWVHRQTALAIVGQPILASCDSLYNLINADQRTPCVYDISTRSESDSFEMRKPSTIATTFLRILRAARPTSILTAKRATVRFTMR